MKVCRIPLLFAAVGSVYFAFAGCGEHTEVADSSSGPTQAPALNQTASSNQTEPSKAGWITSYEQGQEEAKANNKLVLLNFTGSDWCGWCIMLDREVFSKPKFKEYASKNLVLVEVDFPKMKPISEAVKLQNYQLAQRYQVQGFPTIIVLNGNGQVVGALGYMQGGVDAFLATLEKMRKG